MKKIIVDVSISGIKSALLQDKELIELMVDSYENSSLVGNIYSGKVERIIPNQFAFINIGDEKNCFLQLEDHKQRLVDKKLKMGENLTVQVLKDKHEEKGAFVTTEISLPGRYAVLLKGDDNEQSIGISQKIGDENLRRELKKYIGTILPKGYNIIIRTEAAEASFEDIKTEIEELYEKLRNILNLGEFSKPPAALYIESKLEGIIKPLLSSDIEEIIVNSEKHMEDISRICRDFLCENAPSVTLYEGELDILSHFGIDTQIEKALHERVWLKSGGFLIIEETKACTVIDVNTGKFINKKNREKLILQNNFEAAKEIAKQLRLRNISGMIIVDFVDLYHSEDRERLLAYFSSELKKDRLSAHIVDYSRLNIVQLTRKKTHASLKDKLTDKCPLCDGTGHILKTDYIAESIYKKVKRILVQTSFNYIKISSNKKIIHYIEKMKVINALEKEYNAKIELEVINTGRFDYFELEKQTKGE
ncbi:Rne/Rng family ribonuclease [Anaeropeptidivorans aminofermentans]|uniref:Rne/Rng family ribonuclease n=1 Tax=Anaeropeptidivorans aminofermentans TaxID=2934315 RepID=UPI0020250C05|nr:Rne/Rng family ribonuclease [Anaeropeptidivorans aminofermentans]